MKRYHHSLFSISPPPSLPAVLWLPWDSLISCNKKRRRPPHLQKLSKWLTVFKEELVGNHIPGIKESSNFSVVDEKEGGTQVSFHPDLSMVFLRWSS